jgi:hypothetical protein
MFLLIILLFMGVMRTGVQFNAGRWLEGVRTRRFTELASSTVGVETSAAVDRESTVVDDDDEAQLAAYNDYLARLNGGAGPTAGSAH